MEKLIHGWLQGIHGWLQAIHGWPQAVYGWLQAIHKAPQMSPKAPQMTPKAAPRPPRASSGLGLGQEANWGDSGGAQIHPDLRFPLFFDDLELIPGIPGIPGIRGSSGSCPQTPVRDLPSTRAGGQDDVSSTQTPSKYTYNIGIIYV